MSTRELILQAIRAKNQGTASTPEWSELPRRYRRLPPLDRSSVLLCFEDRLRDYDATVLRCAPQDVTATIARRLADLNVRTALVAADFNPDLADALPVDWRRDTE